MPFVLRGRPARSRRLWRPELVLGTGACAVLALLLAVLLPLAPVLVNVPTVRWPVDPSRPTSTLLSVTAYRPVTLDLRFSCRAARAAAEFDTPATVVSTVNPALPEVADLGLIARVGAGPAGDELTVDAVGTRLVTERLPDEDCQYRVHGDPATGLVVARDGVQLGRGPTGVLPDVDLLATSLGLLPDATPADLGVELRLDDEFATSPTGLKSVLIVLLVLALAGVCFGLWRLDRAGRLDRTQRLDRAGRLDRAERSNRAGRLDRTQRLDRTGPRPRNGWRPALSSPMHPADAVVGLAMLGWLLLAPSTDDDGYYAAMAANSRVTGYVGNYYQLYDQSFTPITWFYQVLGAWQAVAGTAPVAQRMLALVIGLLTWGVVRTYVSSALRGDDTDDLAVGPTVRALAPAVAATAFLAWWLPQNMGVRPEGAVALLASFGLLAVRVALRRRLLLTAWAAAAAAGLALATHTTGLVGLAPLLAGAGGLWRLVRVPGRPARTGARAAAVLSGGATAALAGFADGSLRDFVRAQQIFLDIQPREYWYTEHLRWYFLLGESAMGNYAKRVAILLAVVGLVWFLVLAAAGRGRGHPLPAGLRLAGWTLVASFGLLWPTPSKWTHHFGALAGVGPVFLTLLLVAVVPLGARVFGAGRVPMPVLGAAAGSVLVALTLAGHGRNAWPYAWMAGFADVDTPPDVGPFVFGSPLSWAVVLLCCAAGGWAWTARRGGEPDPRGSAVLRAVALFAVVGLAINLVYLFGSFTLSARNTVHGSWSLWGANVSDPAATRCGAADAVSVYDPFTARPLTEVMGLGPVTERAGAGSTGFQRAGGYYLGYQPPVQLGTGAATAVWGSLAAGEGKTPDRGTGEMRTPWYRLPAGLGPDQAVTVLLAGAANQGNSLSAEYAAVRDDRLVEVEPSRPDAASTGTQSRASTAAQRDPSQRDTGQLDPVPANSGGDLDDTARDPRWRSVLLDPPAGAQLVRLHAVDNSAGPGGWLAFGAPAVARLVPLRAVLDGVLGPDRPVALAWQVAFGYPCLRQPEVRNGITEPPAAAVLWAERPIAGTRDATWLPFRGGLYGQVLRSQSVLQLTARVRGTPDKDRTEVLVFDTRLARDAYTVTTRQRRSSGWAQSAPTPTRTLNALERCVQEAAAMANPTAAARCVP